MLLKEILQVMLVGGLANCAMQVIVACIIGHWRNIDGKNETADYMEDCHVTAVHVFKGPDRLYVISAIIAFVLWPVGLAMSLAALINAGVDHFCRRRR